MELHLIGSTGTPDACWAKPLNYTRNFQDYTVVKPAGTSTLNGAALRSETDRILTGSGPIHPEDYAACAEIVEGLKTTMFWEFEDGEMAWTVVVFRFQLLPVGGRVWSVSFEFRPIRRLK